jgi:NAD(P)-dependent dehydrogenase (short-subunit alcohol dehydrogenase family)
MSRRQISQPLAQRIALVTGGNRGIGFEVCRQLGAVGLHVILTARDSMKGRESVAQLHAGGATGEFHQLDVTNEASIRTLATFVRTQFGGVDVLINNAAVYPDEGRSVLEVALETFRTTMETNVYGPLRLCQVFVPLMRAHGYGRIVNVSSGGGQLTGMTDDTPAYRMSKAALNALTCMVANAVGSADILVNAVCPGWVRTAMGGPSAPRTVEQAAGTIVWLATLPAGGPTGGFFRDRQPIPW